MSAYSGIPKMTNSPPRIVFAYFDAWPGQDLSGLFAEDVTAGVRWATPSVQIGTGGRPAACPRLPPAL